MNTILAVLASTVALNSVWNPLSVPKADLLSKELVKGELVLTFRTEVHSGWVYANGVAPPPAITVWREIYGASNGVVVLKRRLDAKVTPESTVPEKVEWRE